MKSRRGASAADARFRSIPDEHILEFLAAARRRLATAAPREAAAYGASVATLELEAQRRGLEQAAPHEPMPAVLAVAYLRRLAPSVARAEWARLLAELELPGLWLIYLYAQEQLAPGERVQALALVCLAVDRIVYGDRVARARSLKYVDLPNTDEDRLRKLNAALERTFGTIFDRMAGGEPES